MHTIVCVKQVPASTQVRLDPVTQTIVREGSAAMLNPFDAYALEAALRLREHSGGTVTVLSMGIPSTQKILVQTLAMGADRAILLSDRALAGADTLATAYTLATAIRKLGGFDLILCGKQAIDGDTAQVGPSLAEKLAIPHLTSVSGIESISTASLVCRRMMDEGYQRVRLPLPALMSVVKEINTPRFISMAGYQRAKALPVELWQADNLDLDSQRIGLQGSPTWVVSTFVPQHKKAVRMLGGDAGQAAKSILSSIKAKAARDEAEA